LDQPQQQQHFHQQQPFQQQQQQQPHFQQAHLQSPIQEEDNRLPGQSVARRKFAKPPVKVACLAW
jgi:hypothetical protein